MNKLMKKAGALVLTGAMAASMCMGASAEEEVELVVFAAASMTETMTEIAEMYKEVAPNVTITYNFDSSGTLKTQIQEGADCDLFISAAQKQMNQLDINADASVNEEGLDFVVADSRIDLVENKVVLVVPEGNPAGIESFDDLTSDKLTLLCLGNEDVPVGAYSDEILESLGIDKAQLEADGKVTYGTNVKEVTSQVSEAAVDAGIIYATDAYSAGLTVVDEATSEMCRQVIYPAAVLNVSQNPEEAQAFLDYLQTDDCAAVFEEVGFTMVQAEEAETEVETESETAAE
ncbi:MAG: molybdate ABC transporter substrate-binding protein [Eubacteriales bacterium]|nr:molybdate ABC transporter substrate-binding protein [Eubacteriales bacterium]